MPIPAAAQPICSGRALGQVPGSPSCISCFFINRYCHPAASALCFYPAPDTWQPLGASLRQALRRRTRIRARSFFACMTFLLLFPQMFSFIPQWALWGGRCTRVARGPSGHGGWEGGDPSWDRVPLTQSSSQPRTPWAPSAALGTFVKDN